MNVVDSDDRARIGDDSSIDGGYCSATVVLAELCTGDTEIDCGEDCGWRDDEFTSIASSELLDATTVELDRGTSLWETMEMPGAL